MGDFKPAMVWPLADCLAEEMEERGWTCVDLAMRMPGDYASNIGVINVILAISSTGGPDTFTLGDDVAEGLALAFGVSPQLINGLHKSWVDNPQARQPFNCPEHLFAGIEFPESAL